MRRGWVGLVLRVVALAAVLAGLAWWFVSERNERAEMMKKVPVLNLQIRMEGWEDDPLFGRQYRIFYAGTAGRLPLDCRQIADLYESVGCKPALHESVNGGCKLTFKDKPPRTLQNLRINGIGAKVTVAGPVQQADMNAMTEAVLNLSWDYGVKAAGVQEIKQTTSPNLWEGEFIFRFAGE